MTSAFLSLFEFNNKTEVELFSPINDRVMGGVSQSSVTASAKSVALFSGVVSLENRGGFASVRAPLSCLDLSNAEGITIRAKGDGKRYKLRLTNSSILDSIVYQSEFTPPLTNWGEIQLPFSSFIPVWRGKVINQARPFDKKAVCSLGILISDQQVGQFSLQLDWIRSY